MAMEVKRDDLVRAFRWKLGLDGADDKGRYAEIWARLENDRGSQGLLTRVSQFLSRFLERAVQRKLGLGGTGISSIDENQALDSIWEAFVGWLEGKKIQRSPLVSTTRWSTSESNARR